MTFVLKDIALIFHFSALSVYVVERLKSQSNYSVTALLPRDVDPQAFDWATKHVVATFKASAPTICSFNRQASGDVLLFAHIARFLVHRAVEEDESVLRDVLASVTAFARCSLAAVQAHEEENLSALSVSHPELRAARGVVRVTGARRHHGS